MNKTAASYYVPSYVTYFLIDENILVISLPTNTRRLRGESATDIYEICDILEDGDHTISEITDKTGKRECVVEEAVHTLVSIGAITKSLDSKSANYLPWLSRNSDSLQSTIDKISVGVLTEIDGTEDTFGWSGNITYYENADVLYNELDNHSIIISVLENVCPNRHLEILKNINNADVLWLPVRIVGTEIRFGPMTTSDNDACYKCYLRRMMASRKEQEITWKKNKQWEETSKKVKYPSEVYYLTMLMSSLESFNYFAEISGSRISEGLKIYNIFSGTSDYFDVLRLPNCDICKK